MPDFAMPPAELVARLRAGGSVFAEDEADLLVEAASAGRDLNEMLDRRLRGDPLEHILGWAAFAGLRVRVGDGVFVPRRRTELLVELALAETVLAEPSAPAVVLDLCCGSGAAGAAVAAARPAADVFAADIDPRAARSARSNLPRPENVFTGDLFDALPERLRAGVDVIIANAPYVPTDEIEYMPQDARLHEPRAALDGGVAGIEIQRRVAQGAPAWLARGGVLLIETSERQADLTADALREAGFSTSIRRSNALDATAVVGVHRA